MIKAMIVTRMSLLFIGRFLLYTDPGTFSNTFLKQVLTEDIPRSKPC